MSDDNRRKRNLAVCIPPELQNRLERLARHHGFSKATYATIVVCDAIRKGRKFEAVEMEEKIAEDVSPPQEA